MAVGLHFDSLHLPNVVITKITTKQLYVQRPLQPINLLEIGYIVQYWLESDQLLENYYKNLTTASDRKLLRIFNEYCNGCCPAEVILSPRQFTQPVLIPTSMFSLSSPSVAHSTGNSISKWTFRMIISLCILAGVFLCLGCMILFCACHA